MDDPGVSRRQVHASCAARRLARDVATGLAPAVLIIGPPGAGKSDLLLRLLDHGFALVADDRVDIDGDRACAPASLAGMLEVRGLGIVRLPYLPEAQLRLVVELGSNAARLPAPAQVWSGLPAIEIDSHAASAPARVALALDCALGRVRQVAGVFAA